MTAHCLVVCALQAEANPLIDYYRLSPADKKPVPAMKVWHSDNKTLVVSGPGKVNAAIATATVLSTLPANTVCVNLGIAGCDRPIGTLLRASKITDAATNKSWYPMEAHKISHKKRLPGIKLLTLDKPGNEYTPDLAFEMEASGFYQSACMFSVVELIHSLKVVSDNSSHPVECLLEASSKKHSGTVGEENQAAATASINNKGKKELSKWVESLLRDNIPDIDYAIKQSLEQAEQLPSNRIASGFIEELYQNSHFTESQKHQLINLLDRYQVLLGNPSELGLQDIHSNSSMIIETLKNRLNNKLPKY